MTRTLWVSVFLSACLWGVKVDDSASTHTGDTEADTDTDADTDSDTDTDTDTDSDTDTGLLTDWDRDGYAEATGDCDDGNGAINPLATDVVGDAVDQNCDGVDGFDDDGDGYAATWSGGDDCEDTDPAVNPLQPEVVYDGIDQDCDGADQEWQSVAAGSYFSAGISVDGSLIGWGVDSSATDPMLPFPPGTYTAVAVSRGNTLCALDTGGSIRCTGSDASGAATPPPGVFVTLTGGSFFFCALDGAGRASCWGDDGSGVVTDTPSTRFVQLSAAYAHVCGVTTAGELECWGYLNRGSPGAVPVGQFVAVESGDNTSCGIRDAPTLGEVTCWGSDTSSLVSTVPSQTYSALAMAGSYACGIQTDGLVSCWGTMPLGLTPPPPTPLLNLDTSGNQFCGVRSDGPVACWGYCSLWTVCTPPQ